MENTTVKVSLDVPDKIHLKVKREQLDREIKGEKINLKDLYYELIESGLENIKKANQ